MAIIATRNLSKKFKDLLAVFFALALFTMRRRLTV